MKNLAYPIVLLTVLFSCSPEPAQQETPTDGALTAEQMRSAGVEISRLGKHTFRSYVSANGFIDVPPDSRAEINTYIEVFVTDIYVIVGDKVKKGQSLARMTSPEFLRTQQSYIEDWNAFRFLEEDYKRSKILNEEKITAQKEFQLVESNYLSAKARVQAGEKLLQRLGVNLDVLRQGEVDEFMSIRAPFDGEITSISAVLGSHHQPGERLFDMVNYSHRHAELRVFEQDLARVEPGQKVEITVTQSGLQFAGTVHQASTVIDQAGRFGQVHVDVPSTNASAVGAYIQAKILTDSKEVWAVPAEAVVSEGDASFLFVPEAKNGRTIFQKRQIETGLRSDAWVEVLNLESDLLYVSKGVYYLSQQ